MSIIAIILFLVGLFFITRGAFYFIMGSGLFAREKAMFVKGIFDRRKRARIRRKIEGLNHLYQEYLILKSKYDMELAKLMNQYTKR